MALLKMIRCSSGRIFLYILVISLFMLWYIVYISFLEIKDISFIKNMPFVNTIIQKNIFLKKPRGMKKLLNIKFILLWTSPNNVPFLYLEEGQRTFIKKRCHHINCYVTANRNFLEDYTEFDAIIFSGPDLVLNDKDLPTRRSVDQKYVFTSMESPESYLLCSEKFENYFNWTWTYRLDSECRWGYIAIRDKNHHLIGPKKIMHWMKLNEMEPVNDDFKKKLTLKTKAAVSFVSNCDTISGRDDYIANLNKELQVFDLSIDTYGECGNMTCPRENQTKCDELIRSTYYFYLAFENSFAEDYVTEILLHGLNNNAIPIVYGGANYTRFMPEGIYLDARILGAKGLAAKMNELIKNPDMYAEYFKWMNHYTYHERGETVQTDDFCGMCKLLNNVKMMKTKSVYKKFRDWWNPPYLC